MMGDSKKHKEKILGVNRKRFILYVGLFSIGVFLVAIAIILKCSLGEEILYDVFLAIGSGVFPSAIVAYLTDLIAEQESARKEAKMREYSLWGIPHGFWFLAKQIVNRASYFNCIFEEKYEITLIAALDTSLNSYFNHKGTDQSTLFDAQFRDEFKKSIEYSFALIKRDVPQIVSHRLYFVNEDIFTEDEICTLEYLLDQITTIENTSVICELGEYLKLLFENALKIKEINDVIDIKIVFNRNNSFRILKGNNSRKSK